MRLRWWQHFNHMIEAAHLEQFRVKLAVMSACKPDGIRFTQQPSRDSIRFNQLSDIRLLRVNQLAHPLHAIQDKHLACILVPHLKVLNAIINLLYCGTECAYLCAIHHVVILHQCGLTDILTPIQHK